MPNALMPDTSSYAAPGVNKLLATASNDPNAALQTVGAAQQMVGQSLQNTRQQVAIDQDTFNLHKAKFDALHQIYGSLVADPSMDNFNTQLSTAVQQGVIDAPTAKAAAAQVMSFGGDPAKLRQFALNGLNVNATHGQVLEQTYGTPGLLNTGGSTVSTLSRTGPNAGTTVGGGAPIANTLNPGQKTSQVQYLDGNGAGKSAPVGTLFDDQGNPRGAGYSVSPFGAVARGGQAGGALPAQQAGQDGAAPVQATPISFGGPQAGAAPQGAGASPQAGQDGRQSQDVPAGMAVPNAQTLPVITKDQAAAATARVQAGQGSAADRNLMRGYAVQNNIALPGKSGVWEPQPAGVGAAAVPAQAAAGGAPVSPGRQPPPQATGASAPPAGMAVQPGSDGGHLVRTAPSPDSPFAAPASASSPAGAGGVLTTSLSPGQQASITAGAGTYQGLQSDVANPNGSPQRVFNLTQALDATRGTNTGRGTAFRQDMLGYLDALPGGIGKIFPGVDPTSLTNYDLATKYTNAIAMGASGASRSDQAQALASSANANTGGMTQGAAQHVIINQIGQERAKQGLVAAFNATGQDPGNFAKFATTWWQGVDPRAFALGSMTPQERAAMVSSLQGPAKAAFLGSVRKGLQAGVLTPSDLQGAAGNGQ